tara:strand:+ start:5504 stop:6067 length:564 start_codon:yes stop_codon:yes gene_type:complete
MVHKIFTPSWLQPESIKFDFFLYGDNLKNPQEHTKNQLLKLLNTTKEEAGELLNYDYFENLPSLTTSISHGQIAGAVISVDKSESPGVGVDVEQSRRVIDNKTSKFFINSNDMLDGKDDLIYTWTKKEAAFKAIAPLSKKIKILNHLWIRGNEFGEVGLARPQGEVNITLIEGQIVATAYVLKTTHP